MPGSMPAATRPRARPTTWSRNWRQLTSCQPSGVRRANCAASGATLALSHTGSVRFAASPMVATAGTENSRTPARYPAAPTPDTVACAHAGQLDPVDRDRRLGRTGGRGDLRLRALPRVGLGVPVG